MILDADLNLVKTLDAEFAEGVGLDASFGTTTQISNIIVDKILSVDSENPIANKIVTQALNQINDLISEGKVIKSINIEASNEDAGENRIIITYYDDEEDTIFIIKNGSRGSDGITPRFKIDEKNYWCVSYDNGVSWINLNVIAKGEDGEDGTTPTVEILNGNWYINGQDSGVTATGNDGITPTIGENGHWFLGTDDTGIQAQGPSGQPGVTPQLKIESQDNNWYISYDKGNTWQNLNVKATGENGNNGITPQLQIKNDNWWVSYNNGTSWIDLEVKAVGKDGENGDNGLTPFINENGYWQIGEEATNVKAQGNDGINGISCTHRWDGTTLIITSASGTSSANLIGPIGPEGAQGVAGLTPYINTEGNWQIGITDTGIKAAGADGASGKSAYEIAQENNFVGSEKEWLESLKGEVGPQGVGITDATIDDEGKLVLSFSDSTDKNVGQVSEGKFKTDILTVNALGGIAANENLNDLTTHQILTKLLYPYVAFVIDSTSRSAAATTLENGATQTLSSVSISITKKSEPIISVTLYNGSTFLGEKTGDEVAAGGTITFSNLGITISKSNNPNLKFTVTDGKTSADKNVGASTFVYPYYWGECAADATIDEALIEGLTKKVESKSNKTVTHSCENGRMIIAYPKANGVLKSILDPNNFETIGDYTRSEVSVTGLDGTAQTYYVYASGATTVTDFKVQYKY